MEGVRIEDFVPCTSSLHGVAFININFHLPGEFPLGYIIKAKMWAISSDTHQLHYIPKHHFII